MSRKRAIEEAMKRLREIAKLAAVTDANGKLLYEGYPRPGDIESELESVWTLARIAGLREAARMCVISAGPDLRKHARELAKKARGK